MNVPLLKTKINIPTSAGQVIPRVDLLDRLNNGLNKKLTLVSAPAGFGKTTLLGAWAAGCPRPLVWLSIDAEDNELGRFLLYVVASLQTLTPEIGKALPDMIQNPQLPPMPVLLTTLINDIADFQKPLTLVLDDYHLIENRTIHEALMYLFEHQPPNIHLVIATRADPPFPLPRMRGRGELHELRERDLRFSQEEAVVFFTGVLGLDLSEADIAALTARTEGWVSGLQMAGLSLTRREKPSEFIAAFTGSQKFIADYLTDEVLRVQPERIQNFLLYTSVLGRLSGPLCAVVFPEAARSQEILVKLQEANLFIVSLDEEQRWFRYHHLFADLLQQRLEITYPGAISGIHRRASEWFKDQGLLEEAIHHALVAEDFERVAAMLEDWHEVQLFVRGSEQSIMRKWLAVIPEALITSRPRLCFYHGVVAFLAGKISQAKESLSIVEKLLSEEGDNRSRAGAEDWSRSQLAGRIASMRAYIAWFQGDIPGIIQWSQSAMEKLPESDLLWRSLAILNLGDAFYLTGDMEAANRMYIEAVAVSRAVGNFFITMSHSIKVGLVKLLRGQLHEVARFCQEIIELAEGHGFQHTPRLGSFYLIWGEALCEQHELDQAWEYVTRGAEMVGPGEEIHIVGWSYLSLIRIAYARGDMDEVENNLRKLERLAMEAEVPIWIGSRTAAWKIRFLIRNGQGHLASQVIKEQEWTADSPSIYMRGEERLALARVLIVEKDLETALPVLHNQLESAEAGERVIGMIQTLILLALVYQGQGNAEEADLIMARALEMSAPEGFVQFFVDEGPPVVRLLRRILRKSKQKDFVRHVLAIAEPGGQISGQQQPLLDPLSERELEILRYLQTNLTSNEIAQELFIATSTVRSHMKSIYSKLDAHSRREAIQIGAALGLIWEG